MKLTDFYRRIKVEFTGEDGIDSGGLSKEAFLLLSKQAAVYAGPQCKQWMVPLSGTTNTTTATAAAPKQSEVVCSDDSGAEDETLEGLFFVSNTTINTLNSAYTAMAALKQLPPTTAVTVTKTIVQSVLTQETISNLNTTHSVLSTQFFQFLGKLLGKALFDRQLVDFPLSSLLLQHMLGGLYEERMNSTGNIVVQKSNKSPQKNNKSKPSGQPQLQDTNSEILNMLNEIKYLDSVLYKQLHWIATNNVTNIIYENFSVTEGDITLPLCANGDSKESFHEFIPLSILKENEISKEELNLILNGKATVDVEEIRAYCIYQSADPDLVDLEFNETHDSIVYLWRLFRELSDPQRRLLLKFFTGSSRVPLDGYDPPLNITEASDSAIDALPHAHTCFNQLVIGDYSSYEKFKEKVMFAVKNTEGFALA